MTPAVRIDGRINTVPCCRPLGSLPMPVEFAFVFAGAAIAVAISLGVAVWFERSKSANDSDP